MRINHHLASSVDLASGDIRIDEVHSSDDYGISSNEMLAQHYTTVVQTKDAMVREALIKLGWTPPPDAPPMLHSRRDSGNSEAPDFEGHDDPPQDQDASLPG